MIIGNDNGETTSIKFDVSKLACMQESCKKLDQMILEQCSAKWLEENLDNSSDTSDEAPYESSTDATVKVSEVE